ncbi:tryptophan halogenase family protein [Novosphingobium sp.]|uniref:tryptophan halogenase family protein n=1 Tax=Novosphingobium sp. TaxID=1874826 RepID=UPI003BAD9DDD
MSTPVEHIVIVGGGTAGWLSACVLGARLRGKRITLVEAPDIPTIGVGEGTWPTMRETLATIGIPEAEFLVACDATFKQGSRFDGWRDGSVDDSYLHPFTAPPAADMRDLAAAWQTGGQRGPFAAAITPQHAVCAANLAPRQRAMPDYAGALNYGYHLDAGKFAALLMRHATQRLGVTRIAAQVTGVRRAANGDFAALLLHDGASLAGDLFLDCSGQAAILIAGECGAEWVDRSEVSFNDRALAVQVPVEPGSPIAAQTIGTAHEAGWLWDIGLPTRRGIGCVYASRFMSDDRAADILRAYIAAKVPGSDPASLTPRKLAFRTGHRDRFWIGNCLAVGLSAGFIEPLEASAIVLIELSLKALADNFPQSRASLEIHAARFNELFRYRWDRVVEFLKLHYVPSQRPEPYWQAQRAPETIPPRLAECLALWREQAPSAWDFPRIDEMFPAASQQYVLHGMGLPVPLASTTPAAPARLAEITAKARALAAALPTTRDYLDRLTAGSAAARIPA